MSTKKQIMDYIKKNELIMDKYRLDEKYNEVVDGYTELFHAKVREYLYQDGYCQVFKGGYSLYNYNNELLDAEIGINSFLDEIPIDLLNNDYRIYSDKVTTDY